jgi:hypothetical protein
MRRSVLPALALVLVLSGCGFRDRADPDAAEAGRVPATASSSAAGSTTEAARNDRGNIPMQLGEPLAVVSSAAPGAPPPVTLSIDEIDVDPPCQEDFEEPPENGHFVGLLLRATALPAYDPKAFVSFTDYDFRVIGPDGNVTPSVSDIAGDCMDAKFLIHNMRIGPGQEYIGWIVLDVPVTTGLLVYAPHGASTGWEWRF